jgi:hypothetical protein
VLLECWSSKIIVSKTAIDKFKDVIVVEPIAKSSNNAASNGKQTETPGQLAVYKRIRMCGANGVPPKRQAISRRAKNGRNTGVPAIRAQKVKAY